MIIIGFFVMLSLLVGVIAIPVLGYQLTNFNSGDSRQRELAEGAAIFLMLSAVAVVFFWFHSVGKSFGHAQQERHRQAWLQEQRADRELWPEWQEFERQWQAEVQND